MPFVLIEENESYKVGLWRISESENYFKSNMDYEPTATQMGKRLQQYASRAVLTMLSQDFPLHLICHDVQGKPILTDGSVHFNLSHTQHIAAAILSEKTQVGIDIEKVDERLHKVKGRFLGTEEKQMIDVLNDDLKTSALTLCWSIKEAVFKWWGAGSVDFAKDIQIKSLQLDSKVLLQVDFCADKKYTLSVHCIKIDDHWVSYLIK